MRTLLERIQVPCANHNCPRWAEFVVVDLKYLPFGSFCYAHAVAKQAELREQGDADATNL